MCDHNRDKALGLLTFRLLAGSGVDDCKQKVKSEPKLRHDISEANQTHLLTTPSGYAFRMLPGCSKKDPTRGSTNSIGIILEKEQVEGNIANL